MMIVDFYRSTIGKKFVVAVTGLFLLFFVLGHMAGNLKIFFGPEKIDHYAEFLRTFGSDLFGYTGFLWIFRVLLFSAVMLHIVSILQLRELNKKARGGNYQQQKKTLDKRIIGLMFTGGLIIASFIIFHILHMTFGKFIPNFEHGEVYLNIYTAFQNPFVVLFYIVSVSFLGMHLYHGVWSVVQTLGLNSSQYNHLYKKIAQGTALAITIGFASVPLAVLTGILGAP